MTSQLDGMQRRGESSKTPAVPTFEQLLRGNSGDATRWSPRSTATTGKEHDMEDDHTPHKKSVLARVKEKAKKWRNSLSKKKHSEDGNTTPSWGVNMEDEEEDPEYLGAPMYESEMAPERYKESARQRPRAIPVISEKHVLKSSVNYDTPDKKSSPRSYKPISVQTCTSRQQEKDKSPKKQTVNVSGKPAHNTDSKTPGKIQILAASTSGTASPGPATLSPVKPPSTLSIETKNTAAFAPSAVDMKHANAVPGASDQAEPTPAPAAAETVDQASPREHIWDKGVSVKEYIMNKFEPGDDERALSQVISQVISPRKSPGDVGVVEKVRGVVASLLRNDAASSLNSHPPATNSPIPISTNAREVEEEETHGRILQAN
ncbi:hypothetical protein K2173_015802 [Erythroxylum novogranatense]|uniref:Uncharacterized protein n=1 Tax=Erythroxylum novogranatense TaxID=1862640 RepID=A0AAV8SEL4_9ROSI|nr:hypothetical protein K2173_015802 [Erythroxylum novogranatense]